MLPATIKFIAIVTPILIGIVVIVAAIWFAMQNFGLHMRVGELEEALKHSKAHFIKGEKDQGVRIVNEALGYERENAN